MATEPNTAGLDSDTQPTTQHETVASQDQQNESQTASEYIDSQLKLEADAREALPYSFDNCTQPLGPLKQNVYSCLTCNPSPEDLSQDYKPAGICYGCSISCHGEHTLVEIFERRNFVCDCGTTRFPTDAPCTLRGDPATGLKGSERSQKAQEDNDYNKNFRNIFCGCNELYDAEKQKGTMFQCMGLAKESQGGCGEDWWHPECLLGLPRDWYLKNNKKEEAKGEDEKANEEHPVPPGFPDEDDFDTLICYKCVQATPWIKTYADSKGFMTLTRSSPEALEPVAAVDLVTQVAVNLNEQTTSPDDVQVSRKRKADEVVGDESPKKAKVEDGQDTSEPQDKPLHSNLPPAPKGVFSILATEEDFRERFCRCPDCYPQLSKLPQLLEEEDVYKPPVSEDGEGQGGSVGTGSLLDRGEAALSNMDRVKAIEGAMAYNRLKSDLKGFLAPFAESGKAVGVDDIKSYFEKLRGDEQAIKAAAAAAGGESGNDNRREQSGY